MNNVEALNRSSAPQVVHLLCFLVLGTAFSILAGCGEARSGEADSESAETSKVASNIAEAFECDLTRVTISSGQALFSLITALDVDSKGRIYVGDWNQKGVIVLSPIGTMIRKVGGEGAGPGEFRYVRNVQILPGDSLMVYDPGLGRLTVFAPGSDSVAYVKNLAASSWGIPDELINIPGRDVFLAIYSRAFRAGANPENDRGRKKIVKLVSAQGAVLRDSVLVVPATQHLVWRGSNGSVSVTGHPFGRAPVIELGPNNRIYYGWTDSLTIQIFNLQGERVGGFSAPYEPVPVTKEDVEDYLATVEESERKQWRRALAGSTPETWPAFEDFIVDGQGRVWVALSSRPEEPTEWVLFDESGTRLCSVVVPENVDLRAIQNGRAYAVAKTELDVPRVAIYRIEKEEA